MHKQYKQTAKRGDPQLFTPEDLDADEPADDKELMLMINDYDNLVKNEDDELFSLGMSKDAWKSN